MVGHASPRDPDERRGADLTIGVVIPSHDRAHYLPELLTSLLAEDATAEVTLVADGCSDDTVEVASRIAQAEEDPDRLRVVETDGLGAAAARQLGAEASSTDVLLFLDDDVMPEPGLVQGHLDRHRRAADPALVVIGYMPTDPARAPKPSTFPNRLYANEYEAHVRRWEAGEDPLRALWGGHLSLRRRQALRARLADPSLPIRRHEDAALGIRLSRAGMHAVFDRTLASHHKHERGYDDFVAMFYLQGHSRVRLSERYGRTFPPDAPGDSASALPRPLAGVLRVATHPRIHRPLIRLGALATTVADVVHSDRLAELTARVVRRSALRAGALDAIAGREARV